MTEQIHKGHRQRMRARIEHGGIDGLQDHEVLEYMLYSFVPRRDTNEIAHRLIDTFGSLARVFNCDAKHLAQISGMTENAALFLSSMPDIIRKYINGGNDRICLSSRGEARDYLCKLFVGLEEERVYAVALDTQDNVLACELIAKGSRAQVDLKATQIADFAKKHKAVNVLIAHNHPSGSAFPSSDDISLTREICALLRMMDFNLEDHYIFNAKGDHYSFEEEGFIQYMHKESRSFKESLWKNI